VRRNFCGHADRDSVGAVDQKIRNSRGQNVRLDFAAVIVGAEVDGVFVEILEQRAGNGSELRFGITIGGRWVAIDRAEISLTEN
jgi:hypothetical protein